MSESANAAQRSIRSFVKRGGRTTVAQSKALEELWPAYGIPAGTAPIDLELVFARRARRVLEIGFGDGEALVHRAQSEPHADFLGLEVHPPGVGHCLMLAARHGLTNLRIVSQDAVEVLGCRLASGSLDEIVIWFPDPWPKKRHAKRRIVQVATATLMADRLARGGLLRFATDWQPYAEHARDVLNGHPDFGNCAPDRGFVSRPADRLLTKFERRGLRLGHAVYDLAFARR